MKNDFLIAITQLCAEKNLPRDAVFEAIEAALISAYRRHFGPNQNINVKIFPTSGEVKVFAQKEVVDRVEDRRTQMTLSEAKEVERHAKLGDLVEVESTPHDFGRISAQAARQVVLQRLREAERKVVFDEFIDKEGDIVSGTIQRIDQRQITVDLGKTEAVLPSSEQVPGERYRVGQRIKTYVAEVTDTGRGPQVILSRARPQLVRRLFELEVPEIYNGIVEIKAIAREPGSRSKVAVAARQEGVDPVGSCVGLRGIRIQNIVNELNGEKIDVVQWHPLLSTFVANALSPAQVVNVEVNEAENTALVIVPDRQLSLAIGKEGQNARLAARLTGWRIDIKSLTAVRTEDLARVAEATAEPVGEAGVQAEQPVAEATPAVNAVPTEPVTEPSAPVEIPEPAVEVPAPAAEAEPAVVLPEPVVEPAAEAAPVEVATPAEAVTAGAEMTDEEREILRLLEEEAAAKAAAATGGEPAVATPTWEESTDLGEYGEEFEDEDEYDEDEEGDEVGAPLMPTPVATGRPQIRFAEDIFGEEYLRGRKKTGGSGKKKAKRGGGGARGGSRGPRR